MAEVIKTRYMDKATRGYSEYVARDLNALQTISPKEGDRAILLDGSLYICVNNGTWDIAGGAKETDAFIITVTGYITGGCTIDKTYAEILSAAQAGKTIIMIDPIAVTAIEFPLILSPYSFNSDGSGTFVAIAHGDDMRGSQDYRYSITVYPDSTATFSREELSSKLDHTVTFKADGKPYTIVSVKDGQSVSAPVPSPTSESGNFTGWTYEGQKVEFPFQLPSEITNIELEASFKNARTEIEWNTSGLWYDYYQYGYKSVSKTGTGFCLAGHTSTSSGVTGVYAVLVSDNPNSIAISSPATDTFVYNDITYYYKYTRIDLSQFNSITSHSINLEEYYGGTDFVELSKTLLDYYFRKIGN